MKIETARRSGVFLRRSGVFRRRSGVFLRRSGVFLIHLVILSSPNIFFFVFWWRRRLAAPDSGSDFDENRNGAMTFF